MLIRSITTLACTAVLALATASPAIAQSGTMAMGPADSTKPLASPPAVATTTIDGKTLSIKYNSPSMRGRTIMGELVPYNKVWRTGANAATTFVTPVALKIGSLKVPAGTYTLYTLPSSGTWTLILNRQNGQWGTEYNEAQDLGRTEMRMKPMSSPQELMSISFENTHGDSTELHVRWEKNDEYVKVNRQD